MTNIKDDNEVLKGHIRELLDELSLLTNDRDTHLGDMLQEVITTLRMNGFRFVYIGGQATGVCNRTIDQDRKSVIDQISTRGVLKDNAVKIFDKLQPHIFDINQVPQPECRQQLAQLFWKVH